MTTSRHLCVVVKDEIQRIVKEWKTVFDCSLQEDLKELSIAQREWKEFYSGCDNMLENWRCWWHTNEG
jgi:hypothetical protein